MKQILWGKPDAIKVNGRPIGDIGEINYPADGKSNKTKDWHKRSFTMQCELSDDAKDKMFRLVYGERIERLVARMWMFYKPFGRIQ